MNLVEPGDYVIEMADGFTEVSIIGKKSRCGFRWGQPDRHGAMFTRKTCTANMRWQHRDAVTPCR